MKIITTDLGIIKDAVNKTADRVIATFGPAGENVLIGKEFENPIITNDGYNAIKGIEWEGEIENTVARFMETTVKKVNDVVGDARTASIIFFKEIFNAGYKLRDPQSFIKKSPMELKREIKEATTKALSELKKLSQPVDNLDMLRMVASAALEDHNLAQLIAKAVWDVGPTGLVRVQESDFLEVKTEITEGMEIKSGYVSRDMVNSDKLEAILEDVEVRVFEDEVTEINHPVPNKLVIFAPAFSREFLQICNHNRVVNNIYILCVKVNPWDKGALEDIQIFTGGHVAKIICSVSKTTIIGGKGETTDHLKALEAETEQAIPFDKEKLKERIARVKGKIGIIHVGAATDSERKRLIEKIEDAKNATKGALEEGVVLGGGQDIAKVAEILGDSIITEALKSPYKEISKNMQVAPSIIDSYKSLRTALEIASTDAGNLLTVGTTIAIKNERDTSKDS